MPASHPRDGAKSAGDTGSSTDRPDRFAVMLAHDLRNPLNVARGRIALARKELDSDHLEEVMRAHERMDAIIEDYLTLAREGAMVTDEGPVDLAAVAERSWQHVPTHEADLTIETDRVIWADVNRVRQLLENLLRNAVEHGGPEVTVTVGDLENGFFVADDGPGIPAARREAVLDAGYSSAGDQTGVGLAIASTIAEAHGWELIVVDDEGARFELSDVSFVR